MTVWRLQTDTEYTLFRIIDQTCKEVFLEMVKEYFDEAKSISFWKPIYLLRGEPKKKSDFFEIEGSGILAISERAKKVLEIFLKKNIELLPLETDSGRYYAMNILNFIDGLDKKNSEYTSTPFGQIVGYTNLDFFTEKIKNQGIFKIPELPYDTFVTGEFLEMCEDFLLGGLEYDNDVNLIWYD